MCPLGQGDYPFPLPQLKKSFSKNFPSSRPENFYNKKALTENEQPPGMLIIYQGLLFILVPQSLMKG
jgi:hypothetical protein